MKPAHTPAPTWQKSQKLKQPATPETRGPMQLCTSSGCTETNTNKQPRQSENQTKTHKRATSVQMGYTHIWQSKQHAICTDHVAIARFPHTAAAKAGKKGVGRARRSPSITHARSHMHSTARTFMATSRSPVETLQMSNVSKLAHNSSNLGKGQEEHSNVMLRKACS